MLSIITNNPYRVLGVYSNSPTKEIVSNEGKMKAFLKVGRAVSFPVDFSSFLPAIERNEEIVANAKSQIALPNEKLKYAQFWFIKLDNIDDVAFNHLINGDYHQALVLWEKKDTLSSLQNRSVVYLMLKNWASAISYAEKLYTSYAEEFNKAIDQQATVDKKTLINQFVDCLYDEKVALPALKSSISDSEWLSAINDRISKPIIEKLERALEAAKQSKGKGNNARLSAGKKLMSTTKAELPKLNGVIANLQYQVLADKLANEILQSGIDYFNNSDDDNTAYEAMPLQEYASSIAVGSVMRDRCKENVKILQKIIDNLPPQQVAAEDKAIKDLLSDFCSKPDKIVHSKTLLNGAKPHIDKIKARLGSSNSYYLKISTQVVGNALHNVIEEVNALQGNLAEMVQQYGTLGVSIMRDSLKSTLQSAWDTTKLMDKFDLEPEFKSRYNTNRSTLKSLCDQLGISTSSYSSSYSSTSRSTSTYGSSSSSSYTPSYSKSTYNKSNSSSSFGDWVEENTGCVVFIVIALIGMLISMCSN